MTVILEPATPQTTDERVLRGAELLDREQPGWEWKINLDTLDVNSGKCCVLGQTYGTYGNGEDELELWHDDDSYDHGFIASADECPVLTRAWADLIYARRRETA